MTAPGIIDELEDRFFEKSVGQQADVLRRVADLLVAGQADYGDAQLAVFDDVLLRLTRQIETVARVALAERLAIHPNAPPRLMNHLALDGEIDVARPVLAYSPALTEATLVDVARHRGQEHMLAISARAAIPEGVTDVLVERGDGRVALNTVRNPGARFSPHGLDTLTERSRADEALAIGFFERDDVPRQHLVKLYVNATALVRERLETVDRRRADEIRKIVDEVAGDMQTLSRAASQNYRAALSRVHSLKQAGALTEDRLAEFAASRRFEETVVALSLIADLPVQVIERAVAASHPDMVLLIARAVGLAWPTTRLIMRLKFPGGEGSRQDIEDAQANFNKLRAETARKAINFYRLREKSAGR
ncbi:MAG: DUF2336 domain-containing protein [Xanthobacteraceae bacterium]|nr:DUF2336 domain-containing protein [Xanthobacteraceae bacterium]